MKDRDSDFFMIFKDYIEKYIGQKLISWSYLSEILQLRRYKKDQFIVQEGQVFKNEAFVAEGIFRAFLKGTEGEQVNTAFYRGPEIVAPYLTRNANDKHWSNFQAISPCSLVLFDASEFSKLIHNYADIREFAYMVIENELRFKATKEIYFSSKSASERLQFFRETYPGLENRIPLHHIASFLGITIVSLSRLRARMR